MSAVKNGIPLSTDYNNIGNLLAIVNKIHLLPGRADIAVRNEAIVRNQTPRARTAGAHINMGND